MATKLGKSAYPAGHGPNDFSCFGPPATKDGDFDNVKICDMGCFAQGDVDSNKYYHAAIIQSKINSKWYVYFEWGRTGATSPQFQFIECGSEREAQNEFAKQLHSKNDGRGEWVTHPTLGRILQAKAGKDCYLVRPQATRSTGLPDAKTIKFNEGAKTTAAPAKTSKTPKPAVDIHPETVKLMRDLNVGVAAYTRGAMTDKSIPTQAAIDECKDIVNEALKRIAAVGHNLDDQVNDVQLKNLTAMLYGRIPKKKDRGAGPETWILSQNNCFQWQQDLDAFESALYATDIVEDDKSDIFYNLPYRLQWLSPKEPIGEFIHGWMPGASRNVHGGIGKLKIKNLWTIDRPGDLNKLSAAQDRVLASKPTISERPLHQPARADLDRDAAKRYLQTNTSLLFHGTRSVNLSGILKESLRLPKQLVGVTISGAMFGGGLYNADDWRKSVGYTSHSGSYYASGGGAIYGRGAFMFVCDTVLGSIHVARGSHGYTEAPKPHHSVMGKIGKTGGLQNNEYIVYNTGQLALRYVVEFDCSR